MPCIPLKGGGFVCIGNKPVYVIHGGRRHYFEWTDASGWIPCTKDGDERLGKVPEAVWELLEKRHGKTVQDK